MKNNIKAFRNFIVNKIIGINNAKKTVFLLTRLLGLTLRNLYYDEQLYYVEQEQGEITYRDLYYELNGISKYNSFENSGKKYLMNVVLPKYIKENAIIFDAGAYIGEYALNLIRPKFPKQKIFAFEPNSYSFSILQENTKDDNQIHCYQLGLSSLPTTKELYDYGGSGSSVHSTIYQEVFSEFFHERASIEGTKKQTIKMTSLDEFCQSQDIEFIDFLKIDTEGHELEVLKGANNMLSQGKIQVIQFEFNEMNIMSRVFLKDFYDLLKSYFLFRLDTNRLIPLFDYSPHNEIFSYQNFIAIHKDFYQEEE